MTVPHGSGTSHQGSHGNGAPRQPGSKSSRINASVNVIPPAKRLKPSLINERTSESEASESGSLNPFGPQMDIHTCEDTDIYGEDNSVPLHDPLALVNSGMDESAGAGVTEDPLGLDFAQTDEPLIDMSSVIKSEVAIDGHSYEFGQDPIDHEQDSDLQEKDVDTGKCNALSINQ